jgi:predicted  nucleic acid-binding Zn-ribbon protein
MEKFEALWAYQTEDLKAEAIAIAIKRSPIRQKVEKAVELIKDRQKQYKQIEDEIAAMADRKEIISQAVENAEVQLSNLQARFESNPPQNSEEVKSLLSEVSRCRETIRQYEVEIGRIAKEAASHDKLQMNVRREAAAAKKTFDQLKAEYEEESRQKKVDLENQRKVAKDLEPSVDPALLEEYLVIKRHISPPVVRLSYGQCSGCNTSLPSATLSKIKNGTLVECETCGRMIIQ